MKRQEAIGRTGTAMLALSLWLSGCTLGPNAERPETVADNAAAFVHAQAVPEEKGQGDESSWWRRFGDPSTTELVELALEHNTDIRAAAARVLEADAAMRRARGSRIPQLSYDASASRQKNSFVLPEIGRREIYSTNYSANLNLSWQADLFGKLKRTHQSAWASLLAQEAAQDALRHTVVAQVVRARVQVATFERALGIAQEIQSSWESTLDTVERRYRSGLVKAVDLYLARENLSSTQATVVQLEGSVEQSRLALDVLVGRRPGTGVPLPDTLPELPSLEPVPLGLPAELLDRRPDLRQAEMQLAAATYGIGAALADLFPSLTLTASGGAVSDTLSDLVSLDGLVYNAVAGLVGPIFTGGQRRADVDAARARAEQATAVYAGTVLIALREVEDALVLGSTTQERLAFTDLRVSQARAADRLAKERYQRGVESLLFVLETERRLRSAEEALINNKADLWNARIDLFLALGGDWKLTLEEPQSASIGTDKEEEES